MYSPANTSGLSRGFALHLRSRPDITETLLQILNAGEQGIIPKNITITTGKTTAGAIQTLLNEKIIEPARTERIRYGRRTYPATAYRIRAGYIPIIQTVLKEIYPALTATLPEEITT